MAKEDQMVAKDGKLQAKNGKLLRYGAGGECDCCSCTCPETCENLGLVEDTHSVIASDTSQISEYFPGPGNSNFDWEEAARFYVDGLAEVVESDFDFELEHIGGGFSSQGSRFVLRNESSGASHELRLILEYPGGGSRLQWKVLPIAFDVFSNEVFLGVTDGSPVRVYGNIRSECSVSVTQDPDDCKLLTVTLQNSVTFDINFAHQDDPTDVRNVTGSYTAPPITNGVDTVCGYYRYFNTRSTFSSSDIPSLPAQYSGTFDLYYGFDFPDCDPNAGGP